MQINTMQYNGILYCTVLYYAMLYYTIIFILLIITCTARWSCDCLGYACVTMRPKDERQSLKEQEKL